MVYTIGLNWIGWYYIPNLATRYVLQGFHHVLANYLGIPPPQPGTPAYRQHYRYTYSVVVLGYLLYNLVQSATTMPANFYEVLRVPPYIDESGLKIAFRHFAKHYHPDRPEVGPAGADLFMSVRDVYEALRNPTVRFAYDRFGPDVLEWTGLSTQKEYLRHGLMRASGYHIFTGLFLLVLSSFGKPSPVKYWRYVLFFALFSAELGLLLHPSPTAYDSLFDVGSQRTWLHAIFPRRVGFQHILFLHQLFMFLSTALTSVSPHLFPDDGPSPTDLLMAKFNTLAGAIDREASIILHTDLHSIHPSTVETRVSAARIRPFIDPSPEIMDQLADEMQNMIIERNLMQDNAGPLSSVWEKAVKTGWESVKSRVRSQSLEPDQAATLPSPVSPTVSWNNKGRLPSPRPSPPPPPGLHRKGSSYKRARSVSY